MTISRAEVFVNSPGRNYVTVRLETADGTVGLGDATVNGRELSVRSYLQDHILPLMLDRDASQITDTWQYLYKGAYWRQGPITMAAIAGIDMALWDIAAKRANVPVYRLLGGRTRIELRAYAHAFGRDRSELLESVETKIGEGFNAIRIQAGLPGIAGTYGVSGDVKYEPALKGGAPSEDIWDTETYLKTFPNIFGFIRENIDDSVALLHDVHHRLTPLEAAQLARQLEGYRPFWIEDPMPATEQDAFRLLRKHTTVPIATGEILNSVNDYRILIPERLIDFVRSCPTHAGGITGMRQIIEYASLYGIKTAMHGPSDVSPIGMAASIHLGMASSNFGIQEFMETPYEVSDVFRSKHICTNGAWIISDTPGLGVEFNAAAAQHYPYDPAYLPVARLKDGSMHDW